MNIEQTAEIKPVHLETFEVIGEEEDSMDISSQQTVEAAKQPAVNFHGKSNFIPKNPTVVSRQESIVEAPKRGRKQNPKIN